MIDSAIRQFQHGQQEMKHNLLLVLFLAFSAVHCIAAVVIQPVSVTQATDWGVAIRSAIVATNQVGVWLELSPAGKLATATSALLEIRTANQKRISKTLLPLAAGRIIFYFTTEPVDLAGCTVIVYAKVGTGIPPYMGFQFNIGDFMTADEVAIRHAGGFTNTPSLLPPATLR